MLHEGASILIVTGAGGVPETVGRLAASCFSVKGAIAQGSCAKVLLACQREAVASPPIASS